MRSESGNKYGLEILKGAHKNLKRVEASLTGNKKKLAQMNKKERMRSEKAKRQKAIVKAASRKASRPLLSKAKAVVKGLLGGGKRKIAPLARSRSTANNLNRMRSRRMAGLGRSLRKKR